MVSWDEETWSGRQCHSGAAARQESKMHLENHSAIVFVELNIGKVREHECTSDETFHFHCLRLHMPKIVDDAWEKYKCGVGAFTMQGYERRNKESKNTLRRFSNNKGDVLIGNMKRLWDHYYCEHASM